MMMADIPESLADKLRSLGVQSGAKVTAPLKKARNGIEDVVKGTYVPTNYGEIFKSDVINEINYTHGCVDFAHADISPRLVNWAGGPLDTDGLDLFSTLFIDTETTGLAGGTGTLPFMIGAGRFTPSGFITTQIFTRDPSEERAQLDLLDRMMAGITSIVTYNGKSFDLPILKTRYVMNSMPSPFTDILHFDLLPLSRRLWRRRLENRSLKDIEMEVLGFSRGQMEVPGWEIPVIYFNYLRTGDPSELAGVFYHNAIDIQSLAALFLYINRMAENPEDAATLPALDKFSMAVQMETSGEIDKAIYIYEQLLTSELPEAYSVELHLRYARILKQNGRFDQAVSVLNNGGELNNIHVLIQLAKVLEHQQRDYPGALEWTEKALELLEASRQTLQPAVLNQHRVELTKRKKRIQQKLEKAAD
jgi:uncharacterized protein YprB with RNaseH-like and TPR domain